MIKRSTPFLMLLCALAGSVFTVQQAQAQTTGGPDLYGYIWRDNNDAAGPAYNWIDITTAPGAVQVSGLADDNIVGPFTIGFPFHYYWYDVTTFRVGSNGYIGFSSGSVAHPFPPIPLPTGIQNYIGPMVSDLTFTDNAGLPIPAASCWYWTSPTNDSLVVSWVDVPFWDPAGGGFTGSNSFQIVLANTDSSVTFNYLQQNGVYNNPTNFCTIGIENNSGNIGLMHSHDLLPPAVYSVKFYYPPSVSFTVNDASTVYNNNESTGGLFLSANGAPFVLNAEIKNTGNTTLNPFNVSARVVNQLNQNQVTNTVLSDTLDPGEVQDMVFANVFNPTAPGLFRYLNNTQLTGDATPSNNSKELELHVLDTTMASIVLSFDDSVDAGLGGLSWQGGGGGAGMLFYPPFYPCEITGMQAYIVNNTNFFGFSLMVMDDDGPNGSALTVLDSVGIDPQNVLLNSWNTVTLASPITIDSGGFYVAWVMGGDAITLGQNQTPPFSNRTFEILGQASNPTSWSDYRYREIEDLMINAIINGVPLGVKPPPAGVSFGPVYPNPSSMKCSIDYSGMESRVPFEWTLSDLQGRVVRRGTFVPQSGHGTAVFAVAGISDGVYQLMLQGGSQQVTRRVSIVR